MADVQKVLSAQIPKRFSHSTLDAFLKARFGRSIPYQVRWNDADPTKCDSIEFTFEDGFGFTAADVQQAFGTYALPNGELDEIQKRQAAQQQASNSTPEKLQQRIADQATQVSTLITALKTVLPGLRV